MPFIVRCPRTVVRCVLLATAVLFVFGEYGSARAQSRSTASIDQQVIQASQEWFDALNRGDVEVLERVELNDFLAIQQSPQGIAVASKNDQIAGVRKSTNRVKVARELAETQVRKYGNVAILTGVATYRGTTSAGRSLNSQAFTSEVWVNEGGKWRLAHFQPMAVPPRPAN